MSFEEDQMDIDEDSEQGCFEVDNLSGDGPFRPDLGIIVVLPSELKGVQLAFADVAGDDAFIIEPKYHNTHIYYRTKIRVHGFHVVLCLTDEQGGSEIPAAVRRLTEHYNVLSVVLIGVSGSLNSKDLGIGHVVIGDSIVDYSYRSAAVDAADDIHQRFVPGGRYWSADDQLVQSIRQFELRSPESYKSWSSSCSLERGQMLSDAEDMGPLAKHFVLPVALHVGPIAAGVSIVKGTIPKEALRGIGKTLQAVDTESHAFADQMRKLVRDPSFSHIHFLIIRAISDPADQSKELLDKHPLNSDHRVVHLSEGGRFPPFQIAAAFNAGSLLLRFIENGLFPSATNQLVEEFRDAKEKFESAKRTLDDVKAQAATVLGGIAKSVGQDHVYTLDKDENFALVYMEKEKRSRTRIADYQKAIAHVLKAKKYDAVRTQVSDAVKSILEERPTQPDVSVKLATASEVRRKRQKPDHVALPPSSLPLVKEEQEDLAKLEKIADDDEVEESGKRPRDMAKPRSRPKANSKNDKKKFKK